LDLIGTPLPSPWEPFYQLQLPPGFGEFTVHWRAIGFSVRDRVVAEQCRYRWKVDGRVDREEISDGQHRWHGKDEMVELLSAAGFAEIVVHGDYSDETFAESRHQSMAFVAVRP
jgi:hypothetical protein